jgi:hypothetical protein
MRAPLEVSDDIMDNLVAGYWLLAVGYCSLDAGYAMLDTTPIELKNIWELFVIG